jgi:serine/threonine protein kinase
MSMIGKALGSFDITSQLGKGGMGEVYQAKDRKLGRDVAIKVLPEEFARDADRVARFQREAKLLASLNHPNIAAIHGLEESGGTNFLVLELVEGETLADKVKRGPIPVEEALKLSFQIAEALEAAHEKGVIHRDLKPANIKITPDGKVKVLDFGLAKAFAGDQSVNLSSPPTLSQTATQQGVILGTAAYMSPEQAKGKIVDRRADIWAFGVVLFEILTGRQLFTGETVSETLASVLKVEPEWKRLPANLHPRIRLLLERCLEKEPRDRYGAISDARVDIRKALADPGGVFAEPIAGSQAPKRRRKILTPIAVLLCIIIVGVAVWNFRKLTPEPRRVIRLDHVIPDDQQIILPAMGFGHTFAASPDGNQLVYSTGKGIFLRSVNELNAVLIPGTSENPQSPFFSPDGQSIGYWSQTDKKLKKISIHGGAPVVLCDVTWIFGAIWYPDDTIVYADVPKGIMRVSANGGTPETLVKGLAVAPQILPDGVSLLFTDVMKQPYRIVVQSLKSGVRKDLFAGAAAHYLPTGHLVYGLQNNSNLFAVAFDVRSLEVKGGPVPIVEGVDGRMFTLSDSGTLVYSPSATMGSDTGRTLVWVDRNGHEEPIAAEPNMYRNPIISPDGTRIAVSIQTKEGRDIWVWDLVRKTLTRLTFEGMANLTPIWSTDSKRIAFWSGRKNASGIYWKAANGTGQEELLSPDKEQMLYLYSLSNDGKYLVGAETSDLQKFDVGMFLMEGDHARKRLLHEDYMENQPKLSPNGRWIAYESDESKKLEIYVRSFPDVNKGRWQVSNTGGDSPLWSQDGRELFYLNGDSVMAVSVTTEPNFDTVGTPKVLFRSTYVRAVPDNGTPWDISPDGKRFLMMKPPAPPGTTAAAGSHQRINIVLNWFEELKQRVPVK